MPAKPVTPQHLFGEVVRAERTRQKLSQEELAFRSGLSTAFMSRIECGRKSVSIETIAKLGHGLGVKGGDLLLRAGI